MFSKHLMGPLSLVILQSQEQSLLPMLICFQCLLPTLPCVAGPMTAQDMTALFNPVPFGEERQSPLQRVLAQCPQLMERLRNVDMDQEAVLLQVATPAMARQAVTCASTLIVLAQDILIDDDSSIQAARLFGSLSALSSCMAACSAGWIKERPHCSIGITSQQ